MAANGPQIPGFKTIKRLGRGGMATVYHAIEEGRQRPVALKVMSNQLGEDSAWARRFIQEANVIAQLTHPSIVPVYDVGEHNGQFYIAMECLEGKSLKPRLSKGVPIPEVLKIVVGVAAGLDYAGEKGFVHRDIKPENIMFRRDGSPVILDFGIVKQIRGETNKMTQTGVIVGTTSYMSPEQAQGMALDHRSDIYSLGIMFYELLMGKVPFKGDTDVATLLKHVNDPVPTLPEHLKPFQAVIDRALAKDPAKRYRRAREMIDHLEQLEPQIKASLTRSSTLAGDEPTTFNPVLSEGDATVAMVGEPTGQTTSITTEEELTQVISSAKATIRDYSAEARDRKARRTKRLITGISSVALLAMAYVGYHQLHVVPKEQAAAEQKIREVTLKSQNKIAALLQEAKQARSGLIPSELAKVDNVVAIYREILSLDPEHKEAMFVLEKFGQRFIEMSKNAVGRRDFAKAATYRDYAEQLVPKSPELPGLRNAIKALRAEQIDREFIREEVETLLSVARQDMEKSQGFSDAAYMKLQQVLRLDPSNEAALELVDTMLENLYQQTEADIARGRFSRADKNIDLLSRYYQQPEKLDDLRQTLADKRRNVSRQQRLKTLMAQASRLEREKRTIAVNDELRSIYLSVLKLSPKHKGAATGLDSSSEFDADIVRQAIDDRDFDRASKQIKVLEKHTPQFSGLKPLAASLASAERAAAKADELLEQTRRTIANHNTAGDQKRKILLQCYDQIQEARSLDRKNPGLDEVSKQLESEYLSTIRSLIADNNEELVGAYFEDAADKNWPSDRLMELKLAQEKATKKTKSKRVVTGGF